MNRRTPLLITSMVAVPMLALHALRPATAQAPPPPPRTAAEQPWTGSVECDVRVSATGYQDRQVHTWTLMGGQPSASGAVQVHPVIWRVKGNGGFQRSQGNQQLSASWTTSGEDKAPFAMFIRASDGKLIIKSWQAQRRVPGGVRGSQQQTIGGVPQTPVPISLEAFEWALPVIDVDPNRTGIKGRISPQVTGSVSPMQPGGANILCNCTWRLQRGP